VTYNIINGQSHFENWKIMDIYGFKDLWIKQQKVNFNDWEDSVGLKAGFSSF